MKHVLWKEMAQRWSGRGRLRNVVFWLAVALSKFEPIALASGIIVFGVGVLLHVISKGHLVRNTQLCTAGPYKWVRHPFYLANFLIDSGICLMAGLPILAAIYVVLFPLAYLVRLLAEEEALLARFGETFKDYQRTTPAFFPKRLPNLFKWLWTIRYENLRVENEISRMVRLLSYPFLIALALQVKQIYINADLVNWELLAGCAVLAISLLIVSNVIHRFEEDETPRQAWRAVRILRFAWILLPALCLTCIFEAHDHQNDLLVLAGVLLLIMSGLLWARFRTLQAESIVTQPIAVFGAALLCDHPIVAPFFALAIWLGCFFNIDPSYPSSQSNDRDQPDRGRTFYLPIVALFVFFACVLARELN